MLFQTRGTSCIMFHSNQHDLGTLGYSIEQFNSDGPQKNRNRSQMNCGKQKAGFDAYFGSGFGSLIKLVSSV